jgi:hypothetical protein
MPFTLTLSYNFPIFVSHAVNVYVIFTIKLSKIKILSKMLF